MLPHACVRKIHPAFSNRISAFAGHEFARYGRHTRLSTGLCDKRSTLHSELETRAVLEYNSYV